MKVWPYTAVPEPDGSVVYYHEGHEPWAVKQAEAPASGEDEPVPVAWRPAIESVVERLAAKDYAGLARDGLVSHSAQANDPGIGTWLEDYPATLTRLPAEAWDHAERGRLSNSPEAWWVVVDLWTAEEGRSDLSMEATVQEVDGKVRVVIDNVHVM